MARLPEHIETSRLELRRWTVMDTPELHDAVTKNIEHLRGYMRWIQFEPISFDDRQATIEGWEASWLAGADTVYGAWLPGDVLVGSIGLHSRVGTGAFEIGYWIDQDHLRKGFAREVASAATTAAFSMTGIDTVVILHDKSNESSAGIPRTLGFTFDGDSKAKADGPVAANDTGIDCRWSVTKDQWVTPCRA